MRSSTVRGVIERQEYVIAPIWTPLNFELIPLADFEPILEQDCNEGKNDAAAMANADCFKNVRLEVFSWKSFFSSISY